MLLPGHWVEVLPASEILQTLDAFQAMDGLPFMPEMLPFCGKRFQVARRAERTCTYMPGPLRRLEHAVTLGGSACDGAMHGGCQMGCVFFWNEAWLKPVDGPGSIQAPAASEPLPVLRATRSSDETTFFCQATEMPKATVPGPPMWRPGQYVRFLRVRTFNVVEMVDMYARLPLRTIRRKILSLMRRISAGPAANEAILGLQPGEVVEVRSVDEILRTLDGRRKHKGLSFGGEMHGQCGRRMTVVKRVDTIMNEQTGKIRHVTDTVLLDGSACDRYLGCARGMPFMWREVWLKRVEPIPSVAVVAAHTGSTPE